MKRIKFAYKKFVEIFQIRLRLVLKNILHVSKLLKETFKNDLAQKYFNYKRANLKFSLSYSDIFFSKTSTHVISFLSLPCVFSE
jgi:hypothetical protein